MGDEFIFLRDDGKEDYWHLGLKTLVKTNGDPDTVAGGPKMPFCSEALDAISRLFTQDFKADQSCRAGQMMIVL